MEIISIQDYINKAVKLRREKSFEKSDQLSLGMIIEKLKEIKKNEKEIIKKYKHEATVVFDFADTFPTYIDSWRGAYNELALNFVSHSNCSHNEKEMTLTQFIDMLKKCIGKTFTGYKGGDYEMDEDTPVWVANYGASGSTAVIDIIDNEYEVIILTGRREY